MSRFFEGLQEWSVNAQAQFNCMSLGKQIAVAGAILAPPVIALSAAAYFTMASSMDSETGPESVLDYIRGQEQASQSEPVELDRAQNFFCKTIGLAKKLDFCS